MSGIVVADGSPFIGDIVVVADESSPQTVAGVTYIVAAGAVLSPAELALDLSTLFEPPRKRPFHWHNEGPTSRARMTELIARHTVVGVAFCGVVGRRGQIRARRAMLEQLSDWTRREGATHLVLEASDQVTMSRDQSTLLDHDHDRGGVPFVYDWRSKNEPLVWVADALAGIVGDWVTGKSLNACEDLRGRGLLEVTYLSVE